MHCFRNPVLYPTEIRGHIARYAIETLSSRKVTSLLSSSKKSGQISASSTCRMSYPVHLPYRPIVWAGIIVLIGLFSGCAASDPPLSINLYNPKTGIQRTCAARESSSKDVSALSSAVESCARQLEAHGFVRSDAR